MFKLIILLAIIYAILKAYNTRDEFRRRDAERERREAEAAAEAEAIEELEEEEEIRRDAVDVDAEVIDNSEEFTVEPPDEEEFFVIPEVEVESEKVH